jgi:hypothetical protein
VERLSAFLDGELEDAERREVQEHLEACPSCAEHLSDLAALDQAARGLGVVVPEGYFDSLPGRVRQRLPARRRAVLPVWAWAAAAALLVAVLTPLLKRDPLAPPRPPAAATVAMPPATRPDVAPRPLPEPPRQAEAEPKRSREAKKERAEPERRNVGPREDVKLQDAAPRPAEGFAEAPAPAAAAPTPAPAAPPAPAQLSALEEQDLAVSSEADRAKSGAAPGLAAGSLAKSRRKQDDEKDTATARKGFASGRLGAASPRTLEEARALREEWRRRLKLKPAGAEGDEAGLGLIEAGAEAFRLGADPRDLEVVRRDAAAYLARGEARHADRVREILRSLEEPP